MIPWRLPLRAVLLDCSVGSPPHDRLEYLICQSLDTVPVFLEFGCAVFGDDRDSQETPGVGRETCGRAPETPPTGSSTAARAWPSVGCHSPTAHSVIALALAQFP